MPLAAVMALIYIFFVKLLPAWVKNNGVSKGLYLWILASIPVIIWVGIFWFGTALIVTNPLWLRLPILWITFYLLVYFFTKEHGEKRGTNSILFHLTVATLGWFFGNWFGILFISTPILAVYYNSMFHLANGIIPISDAENKEEKWQRFRVFFWYTWGLQYPLQIADDKNSSERKSETRIVGSSSTSFSSPGIIWLKSHQAAALTVGINFSRVEGPKVIFTKPFERLLEVVDLRTHLRSSSIDAVTKDGVRFKAGVFASFSLDREEWSVETYSQLFHKNHVLLHGKKPDANIDGIYPFSRPRVHSALMMRGKTSDTPEKQNVVYWDDRVMNQVEIAATHILSDRRFDELWHPINDGPGMSALDEIADKLKERVSSNLLAHGVRLFAARVVRFDFSEYKESKHNDHDDEKVDNKEYDNVVKQHIKAWQVDWESQKSNILANANAESNRLQHEARAYAQSVLLTAIADGLQQTRIRYPNLPRHVIAMHFMGALEQMAHTQSEVLDSENEEIQTNLAKQKNRMMEKRGHYL